LSQLVVAAASGTLLCIAAAAAASPSPPPPLEHSLAQADVVFLGKLSVRAAARAAQPIRVTRVLHGRCDADVVRLRSDPDGAHWRRLFVSSSLLVFAAKGDRTDSLELVRTIDFEFLASAAPGRTEDIVRLLAILRRIREARPPAARTTAWCEAIGDESCLVRKAALDRILLSDRNGERYPKLSRRIVSQRDDSAEPLTRAVLDGLQRPPRDTVLSLRALAVLVPSLEKGNVRELALRTARPYLERPGPAQPAAARVVAGVGDSAVLPWIRTSLATDDRPAIEALEVLQVLAKHTPEPQRLAGDDELLKAMVGALGNPILRRGSVHALDAVCGDAAAAPSASGSIADRATRWRRWWDERDRR